MNDRYATQYSGSWTGQDGREWRHVTYWVYPGWRTFLQVKENGEWRGW